MRIGPLIRDHLVDARDALSAACPFDRAEIVAEEKLFGLAPAGAPSAFGAWIGDLLVGVAALCGNRLRVLAVIPWARKQGVASALLAACEDAARANGATVLRTLDQPGNYLAPGIDTRNTATIAWLEKRGYVRHGDERENVIIAVRDNPRVSTERAEDCADACRAKGYQLRRARSDETALLGAVDAEFGGAWSFELARSLAFVPTPANAPSLVASSARASPVPAVHVALKDGAYCAFAAHDGNNRGLGWFGPTGTWPAHRGNGLGEALLLACLVDVAEEHERCEVAWIGPRPFYEKVAGVVDDRRFIVLAKAL
ncbi:MAG TPA: GNAT family N-acetyltransferase [Kofleriaceae bacterium]|jgi:GNAT superfamily N-acetyltransferase